MEPRWLDWAKRLQAVAQNGLTFAEDQFDIERYEQVRKIAAEMMAEKSGAEVSAVLDLFVREEGYATPKVDVRGAMFREGRILLVKETSDGKWSLPGGWADIGESPSESVEREVREESGFEVVARRLVAVYDRSKHPHMPLMHYHVYKMFFLCEIVGGKAQRSIETAEISFFGENEIPELSETKILPEQIQRMFEFYREPDAQVYFD